MQKKNAQRSCFIIGCLSTVIGIFLVAVIGVVVLRSLPPGFIPYGNEANLKGREGIEIVRAIEAYQASVGFRPAALADLSPRFLPAPPDPKWGYTTNGPKYGLGYYLGRGGVEYDNTSREWTLNYEGSRSLMYPQP